MDFASIITIIIVIAVAYYFFKLVISPLLKLIGGIILFLVMLYVLQHFLNIDFTKYLGPFGKYVNWMINLVGIYINSTILFFKSIGFGWTS